MKQPLRIKILFILFLLTGAGALSLVITKNFKGSSSTQNKPIAVDSASVNKVTLLSGSVTTFLAKDQTDWKVNKKYKARTNLIQLMMVGLTKSEIKMPISNENKQKVIALLKEKGVKVTVEGDGFSKTFYLLTNENDANSSYYIEENSTEPYIVFVPGFTGDMANLFKMTEEGWRTRLLFSSTPMSLERIKVTYPSLPQNNIDIKWNRDESFLIPGIKSVDTSKVVTYLAQFEQVYIDQYIYSNKDLIISSLTKKKPQASIEVMDLGFNGPRTLNIYSESKEPKGIYAIIAPENDLVVMKTESLYRLLVRKAFFEKK